jgi:hypothetical protein
MSHPDSIASAIAGQIRAIEAGRGLRNVVERSRGY